ncbi:MAG: undecaprenyldiphospho-muramoylpentapeptide beta-N-acetylglucosaminyltransferase [Firmicutes bacterium]|nr:undecaprenyldiphospho-muramoylpentapeptide beta-N-acetylglucosaminyltransferase [Bacillota bacterium]
MKMIISAGGTGGHIYPALAIIKKFQEKDKNFEVLYIGTHNRMENKIIPEHNIPYQSLKIYGFDKKNIIRDIKNVGYLIKSYYKCIEIIKEFQPDIVVGVGGYVTLPVIMASRKLNIKTVVHEQNSIPGKTNKLLSRGVDKVFTSFKESNKYFDKEVNCVYTGNPCGDNVKNLKPIKKESLGFSKDKKLVLVTSGSLGSSALNDKLIEFLQKSSKEEYEILFITGERNYDAFIKEHKFSSNVKVLPYLDNLAAIFKSCDLVIGRAGAGTISELMMAKTPSILVPSPNVANNHQYYNAKDLSDSKLAIMIEEKNLDGGELFKKVKKLLNVNNKEYQEIKNNLNCVKNFSSSDKIFDEIKGLVKNVK